MRKIEGSTMIIKMISDQKMLTMKQLLFSIQLMFLIINANQHYYYNYYLLGKLNDVPLKLTN